jgi:LysM repeat protein
MAVVMTLPYRDRWREHPDVQDPPVQLTVLRQRQAARRRLVLRRRRLAALSVVAVMAAAFVAAVAAAVVGVVLATSPGAPGGGPLTATGSSTAQDQLTATYSDASSAPTAAGKPAVAGTWVVRPGDTLWTIVERSGVHGDPRPVVDRLNAQLHGRPLQVGERIAVP